MPLILAIEPDRRQAARVGALAPAHIDAEIVVVESVEDALDLLDSRTPDLVLTPMLLSAKDDAALTGRLRELDTDGREMHTLVTPVLGSGSVAARTPDRSSGLLTRLRKPKSAAAGSTSGCDPALFAEQIKEYLARIAAAQRDREEARLAEAWNNRQAASAPMLTELLPISQPVFSEERRDRLIDEMPSPPMDEERHADPGPLEEVVVAPLEDAPPHVVELSDPLPDAHEIVQREPEVEPVTTDDADAAIEASWEDLESFLEELEVDEQHSAPVAPVTDDTEPNVIELPPPDELWATLAVQPQRAIAPLESPPMKKRRPAPPKKTPKASRTKSAEPRPQKPRKPRQPKAAAKPMQDEWGLYDPEQCGFAALLERLKEMNGNDVKEPDAKRRSVIMRR